MKVDIIITFVYMLMSCPIDAPAESGGVIVLWSIVWDRYACINNIRMYINKVMRLPAYRTIWQHCGLALHMKVR